MNKKFLVAWLVLFILYMAGGFVVHEVLLHDDYALSHTTLQVDFEGGELLSIEPACD